MPSLLLAFFIQRPETVVAVRLLERTVSLKILKGWVAGGAGVALSLHRRI
ncbi:MAG: hypothetical protein ABFS39_06045 [Pseudomonadota bacterium]